MPQRVWDQFLTEQDRAHVERYPAQLKGAGERPALIMIDFFRMAFGDVPEPLLESVKTWEHSCGLAGWEALPHVRRLLEGARAAGLPIVHVTGMDEIPAWHEGKYSGTGLNPAGKGRRARRYDIIEEAKPLPGEPVLRKSAPSAFWGTPLVAYLNGLRVDTLLIAGESTSGCVRATVVDGRSHRYKVMVVEECVFDRHFATHAMNLFDMHQKYADVVSLDDALAYIRSSVGELPTTSPA